MRARNQGGSRGSEEPPILAGLLEKLLAINHIASYKVKVPHVDSTSLCSNEIYMLKVLLTNKVPHFEYLCDHARFGIPL